MLTIVGGPMFSGKTTWLINYAKTLPPGSYAIFKPDIDTRYGKDVCVNHSGQSIPAVNLKTAGTVFPAMDKRIKTILIDELNFFAPADITAAINSKREKIHVIGIGLLFDYKKKPFGATLTLSKNADNFIQLYSRCEKCGKDAEHSYRKINKQGQFLLGAHEAYGACCGTCWKILNSH